MGIHHTVCVNSSIISLRCGLKILKKFLPVLFAFENRFALISTRSYMIKSTGVCYSQRASHIRSFTNALPSHLLKMNRILIAYLITYVKNEDLTPMFLYSAGSLVEKIIIIVPFDMQSAYFLYFRSRHAIYAFARM